MLFGEYAVLEGHPALALCFDARLRCRAKGGGGSLRFDAPELLSAPLEAPLGALSDPAPDPRLALLWPLLREVAPTLGGLSLRFDSDFPPTWGLGSSSASTLVAVAATSALLGRPWSPLGAATRATALQREAQGAASGYDAATQALGGVVRFVDPRLGGRSGASEAAFWPVPPALSFLVAYTGVKASTGALIREVQARFPPGSAIYAQIAALVDPGLRALRDGETDALGEALNAGHALLDELGAVPDDLAGILLALQGDPDVAGARLCGAGGGDCVLILARDPEYAARAATAHGLTVLTLRPTDEGLRLHPPEST